MGWEERRGLPYYYRSQRVGDRVRKVYVGGGVLGELAAQMDAVERRQRDEEAMAWKEEREQMEALEAPVEELCEAAEVLARAALVAAGYCQHKRGEWRKRRENQNPKS